MRRVRYSVAVSLDGYIAGPKGEADWIITDPTIDFEAIFAQFDTFLLGRRTFEAMPPESRGGMAGFETYVFSRTLRQGDYPDVKILGDQIAETVRELRVKPGKDIWLFGGGSLFHSLLDEGLVDTVEVAVIPVLLGEGVPLVGPPAMRAKLTLTSHKVYETGIVSLEYSVQQSTKEKQRKIRKARNTRNTRNTRKSL